MAESTGVWGGFFFSHKWFYAWHFFLSPLILNHTCTLLASRWDCTSTNTCMCVQALTEFQEVRERNLSLCNQYLKFLLFTKDHKCGGICFGDTLLCRDQLPPPVSQCIPLCIGWLEFPKRIVLTLKCGTKILKMPHGLVIETMWRMVMWEHPCSKNGALYWM